MKNLYKPLFIAIMAFSLAFLLWFVIPFWDRKSTQGQQSRFLNYLGLFGIMYILLFTILGWLS